MPNQFLCGPDEPTDADLKEVERFRQYLRASHEAGVEAPQGFESADQVARRLRVYHEHYPEYALTAAPENA